MMSVACKRGVLQEVRICLSKDLREFRSCQQVDRSGCRAREFTVVAPR
jgi:ribonuclease T2